MGQHHDSAPSLDYTVISIDSPHMRKDGSNYLKFLLRTPIIISAVPASNWLDMTKNAMKAKSKGAIFILNLKINYMKNKQL